MVPLSEALAIAVEHHRCGRLPAAEQIYRQILEVEPNHADALHYLGVLAHQGGRHAAAIECISRAIALKGDVAAFHNNLGEAYRALRRIPEAVASFRRAMQLQAGYAEAHSNLGSAWLDDGKPDEAVACFRRALDLKPGFVEAQTNLGNALRAQGRLDEAVACYHRVADLTPDSAEAHQHLGQLFLEQRKWEEAATCLRRAVDLEPDSPGLHNNLGVALKNLGRLDEALAAYRQASMLKLDYAEAHYNLGIALGELGQRDAAIDAYRQALALNPNDPHVHNNLGVVLKDLGKLDDAVACYRQALGLEPDYAEALSNLGNVMHEQGKFEEALGLLRRALELKPDFAKAHTNFGNALKDLGQPEEAVACHRRALELRPDYALAHSNLLVALQYSPASTLATLAAAHAEYQRRHAAPLLNSRATPAVVRQRRDRLRLGFVSPDFYRHPVGYFFVRVLENLDSRQMETVCYSDRIAEDDLSRRMRGAASEWRETSPLSDERLAEQIRSDGIDILFDLAGHTARNRLLVFARKPAPIQITWLGYEGTTGLAAIDYLLADRHMVPMGSEHGYCEQVLRLPDGYVCYDPPSAAPPVGPLPASEKGFVTFASFNNPAKITADVVSAWAEILRRTPGSRLVMKYRGLDDPALERPYRELFAAQGVDSRRFELLPPVPYFDYLAGYNQVDVVLDSFPFSGSTTTCQALWMGVPVVTLAGQTFAGRHGVSHLAQLGLTETIARDRGQYIDLAAGLAGDLPRLAALRAGLRERMAAAPLCDGRRFASNLTALLGEVWERP